MQRRRTLPPWLGRWAWRCLAGLPLLAGLGAESAAILTWVGPPVVVGRVSAQGPVGDPSSPLVQEKPPQGTPHGSGPLLSSPQGEERREAVSGQLLPITLEAVLRLAEEQNSQIALARARVAESCAAADLAGKRWLPDLYVGTAIFRHEGGIQDQNGDLIHSSTGANLSGVELHGKLDLKEYAYQQVLAQRRLLQQKGELRKITNETLLDAASTYLDLLTAHSGIAIARSIQQELEQLLPRTEKMAQDQPAMTVEVERIRAEILARRATILHLRAQAQGASYKLVYLLGLDPCTQLVPVDTELVPIELVEIGACTDELVARALTNGPGIHELESLVKLVEEAVQRARGPGRLLPTVEMHMIDGAFGAGPGSFLEYDNRFDLGLHLRWNLTDLCTRNEKRRIADAQRQQAHLAYQDLRAKLTAGVQEARESILSGREQIALGQEQIAHAAKAHQRSKLRIEKLFPGATATEMMLALQSLGMAQAGHLNAVREYNKAQLRLMLLVGCRP